MAGVFLLEVFHACLNVTKRVQLSNVIVYGEKIFFIRPSAFLPSVDEQDCIATRQYLQIAVQPNFVWTEPIEVFSIFVRAYCYTAESPYFQSSALGSADVLLSIPLDTRLSSKSARYEYDWFS
jgi:hypothetical protein